MRAWMILSVIGVFFLGTLSCYALMAAEADREEAVVNDSARSLSREDQKEKAYEIFEQILKLSDSLQRKDNIPEIKALYRKIIDTYPDLGLAQECYLRLVMLAGEEGTPEGDAEADRIYQEFLRKYPDSRLQRVIENELNRN